MKKLSTWLIIVGIAIAAIPLIGRVYMNYQQEKMYQEYLEQLESSTNSDIMDDHFEEDMTTQDAIDAQAIKPRVIENVIGKISIPSIKSDQLLLEGSSNKEMRFGAGHVVGTALPGQEGNCSISAHRNYTFGSYFSRLGEVTEGDLVKVTYNKATYTYKVTESFVVLPSEVSVLKKTKNPTITLITCHPKGSNTHRLIVKGVLLDKDGNTILPPEPDDTPEPESTTPAGTLVVDPTTPASTVMAEPATQREPLEPVTY